MLGVLREAALDPDDLKQEALVGVWVALPRFDPARASLRTFVERVTANRMTSFIRGLHSGRRGLGKNEPLNELGLTLPAPDDCIDLRADVWRVLAGVSPLDRAVALSLVDYSAVETSRRLGVSRAMVYRAIERLRFAFHLAGFTGVSTRAKPREAVDLTPLGNETSR